ncbi:unnamed protein product [Amaranthus hypochondriacus]
MAWLLMSCAELQLCFMWVLRQSFYWRPVSRTVFPEKLPKDEELPRIDVFICTADPNREPTFDVMNTVLSAMCLDYPANKLSVYVSDDGGSSITLNGIKEAWLFSTWWLPFCKRYNIYPICPKAYFQDNPQQHTMSKEFLQQRTIVKEKYEIFKRRVCSRGDIVNNATSSNAEDHPALVQVINEVLVNGKNPEKMEMPMLVYLARQKKASHPHHFKLRVSSLLSNAPYILVLDCDMYCNDSLSARQSMCFTMDPKIFPCLGWVQFPQKFHNISDTDIYDSEMRALWRVDYLGMDGLEGPLLSGTNFYINRKALLGFTMDINGSNIEVKDARCSFGSSNELIHCLSQNEQPCATKPRETLFDHRLQEAELLASCTYEKDTQWGKEVGFGYHSLVEDVMTGFMLHSRGWKSVYLNPTKPQFLGFATTNLNEALVQGTRWIAGLLQIGLTKHSPLFNHSPKIQLLQRMLYIFVAIFPLDFLPILCFATIPPICFFYGISLYPKVSDPFFIAYGFVFISSNVKRACEVVFLSGGSINAWLNERRFGLIKSVTCYIYGSFNCVMAKLGLGEAKFIPTNKARDDDATKWYQMGKYDFRASNMFLLPILTLFTLNLFSFLVGVARLIITNTWDTFFAQLIFSFYIFIISLPIAQGILFRKDIASIPLSPTFLSFFLSILIYSLAYFFLF